MPQSKSKQIIRRVLDELWNDGKPQSVDELYDKNVKIHVPGGNFTGRDGVRQFLGMYNEAFPDLHVEMEGFYPAEADNGGVLHWTFTGTHEGELMGIKASHNQVEITGMTLSRIKGGKIVEERFVWDRLDQLRQLGVSPEKLK